MAAPRIRVGLMGASGSNPHAWANSTHLPYLLSGAGQKKYELVAICNSSIAAAEAVVAAYKLPAKTKVYGSPAALATDPDVDFVVVSVNVATHYDLVKPALEAGKMAYVEWPLARNIDEAEELAALAEKKGVKTVVGLQGRVEPLVDTIRGIVESGRIGGVLSSTVVAAASQMAPVETQGMAYFLDSKVGGSIVSIHFGHLVDLVQTSLGEITSFQSLLANQLKTITIVDGKTREVISAAAPKNTADHINLHGFLTSGVTFSFSLRGGPQFDPSEPALRWYIYGTKGEVEITSSSVFLNMSNNIRVRIKDADGKIQDVKVDDGGNVGPAANVARLYEAFAKGDERLATFRGAVQRHQFLEEIYGGKLGEPVIFTSRV